MTFSFRDTTGGYITATMNKKLYVPVSNYCLHRQRVIKATLARIFRRIRAAIVSFVSIGALDFAGGFSMI